MNSFMLSFAQGQHGALSKQGFEVSMESYIIDYIADGDNLNRIKSAKGMFEAGQIPSSNDIKSILLFIKKSVDNIFIDEDFGKVGRPSVNPRCLAKAILFCEAVGIPERQAQGWLEIMSPILGIHEKLDDRVIGKAYENPEVIRILKKV